MAGEIRGTNVQDEDFLSVTAVRFEHTRRASRAARWRTHRPARQAAREIARELADDWSACSCQRRPGSHGPDVVAGLGDVLPPRVVVTGGLAADGSEFLRPSSVQRGLETHTIVVSGFYGDRLWVGHGSAAFVWATGA